MLVDFCKDHTSISLDNFAGFQEKHHVRSPSISPGINVTAKETNDLQIAMLAEPVTATLTIPFPFVGQGAWDLAWLLYLLVAYVLKRRPPARMARNQN